MKPQPIDTAPQEEKPLLLYCPEHGEWRIGVRYLDSWLDLYDLDCELWPTHWLRIPTRSGRVSEVKPDAVPE